MQLLIRTAHTNCISTGPIRCFSKLIKRIQTEDDIAMLPTFQYVRSDKKDLPNHRIYAWGNTMNGALGNKDFLKPSHGIKKPRLATKFPYRMEFAENHNVTDIACGYGFTLLAVKHKQYSLFATGLNASSQIGCHTVRRNRPLENIIEPVPVHLPQSPGSVRLLAAGREHSVLVMNDGTVFTLGNNAFGQGCRPIVPDEQYRGSGKVHKVEIIQGKEVTQLVCSQDTTLFLLQNGVVLASGWGADGQTGQGHYKNEWEPKPVVGDLEGAVITHVAASSDCSLAVSEEGEVFGWGNSEYGQLHLTDCDEQQINVARKLKLDTEIGKVVKVAAGSTTCALLNERGDVYVWGFGVLGLGPNKDQLLQPTKIPSTLFGKSDVTPDVKVDSIFAGLSYFAAITNTDDLYTWGNNRAGCLGVNDYKPAYFPLRVNLPASVKKVACSVDHTVALCQAFI